MWGASEYRGGSHHGDGNHGKSSKHPPLHQHRHTNSERSVQRKKSWENFKAVCRNEFKAEKREVSSEVSLLCPSPGLAQGRIIKENIFCGFSLPTRYRISSLVCCLRGFAAPTFWIICHLSRRYGCSSQNTVTHSSLDIKHAFLMATHITQIIALWGELSSPRIHPSKPWTTVPEFSDFRFICEVFSSWPADSYFLKYEDNRPGFLSQFGYLKLCGFGLNFSSVKWC